MNFLTLVTSSFLRRKAAQTAAASVYTFAKNALAGSQFRGDCSCGIFHSDDQALLVGKSHFRGGDTDRSHGLAVFAENGGAETASAQCALFKIAGVALGTHQVEFLVQGDLFHDGPR